VTDGSISAAFIAVGSATCPAGTKLITGGFSFDHTNFTASNYENIHLLASYAASSTQWAWIVWNNNSFAITTHTPLVCATVN
jgi:hypothetical protein